MKTKSSEDGAFAPLGVEIEKFEFGEEGVVPHFAFASVLAEGFFLGDEGDEFGEEFGNRDGPDFFVLNYATSTSCAWNTEFVMISSSIGSELTSFSKWSCTHIPWNPK